MNGNTKFKICSICSTNIGCSFISCLGSVDPWVSTSLWAMASLGSSSENPRNLSEVSMLSDVNWYHKTIVESLKSTAYEAVTKQSIKVLLHPQSLT